MTTRSEPRRNCPFCGIPMVIRRTGGPQDETFECVLCRVVIHVGTDADGSDPGEVRAPARPREKNKP